MKRKPAARRPKIKFGSTSKTTRVARKRTRSIRVNAAKKSPSSLAIFFQRLFMIFLVLILIVLGLYFFVIPSILNRDLSAKNILIVSSKLDQPNNNIYFAHFDEDQSKNLIVGLNGAEVIELPENYGEYSLSSVYQLLKIDKKDEQFTKSVFAKILKTSVDDIVIIDDILLEAEDQNFSQFFFQNFLKKISKFDLMESQINIYLHYLTKNITATSLAELEDFDILIDNFVTVPRKLSQNCSVAVINATGENGRAKEISNIIENIGAVVVRLDDASDIQKKTTVYYDLAGDCMKLAQRLSGIFDQKPEILQINELENAQQYRAKIVVVLGE
jgi:hypothetical protein